MDYRLFGRSNSVNGVEFIPFISNFFTILSEFSLFLSVSGRHRNIWSERCHKLKHKISLSGMVSLYYGYLYTYFVESDEKDISPWLIGVLFVTTIFSLLGAFKSFHTQCATINHLRYRLFFDDNVSEHQHQLKI